MELVLFNAGMEKVKKKIEQVGELEARLIREIRLGYGNSRLELAGLLRVAASTVGNYVDRLIHNGFLREVAPGREQRRGRPIQQLQLQGEAGCFIGIECEQRVLRAICVDFAGNYLGSCDEGLPEKADLSEFVRRVGRVVAGVRPKHLDSSKLLGIGVSVPGVVNPHTGMVRDFRLKDGRGDVSIASALQDVFQVPVALENNARAMALGALMFRSARSASFIHLRVGGSVSAGIVIQGELHYGSQFLAGEVGKMRFPAGSGELLSMESIITERALLERIVDALRRGEASSVEPRDVILSRLHQAYREGDFLIRRIAHEAADALGWLSHSLTLIMNPEVIVLSGSLNGFGVEFLEATRLAFNRYFEGITLPLPEIRFSTLGMEFGLEDVKGALGAASVAIDAWQPRHLPHPA